MNRRQFLSAAAATSIAPHLQAAEKAPIRIGQIGTGHAHAAGKIDVYRASRDFQVVGIAEPDDAQWQRASREKSYQGLPRLSVEKLLAAPGIHAVAVETHVRDLLTHARRAVDAGLHVHLDKPAGTDLATFRKIMADADAAGLTVQMGYMYRFNPAVQLLRTFLDNGWLGKIFEVDAVMGKVLEPATRRELAEFSGGILFELGCHLVDLVVSVLGKPTAIHGHHRSLGDDGLVDNMLAVFDYPDATATLRSCALDVEGFARRHLTVCGTLGTFHIQPLDRPTVTLSLARDCGGGAYRKGLQEIPFEPPYRRYVGDAADFAAIIRGEKASGFPSSHDLAVQECVLRASGML